MKYKSWNRNKQKWETVEIKDLTFGKSRTDTSKYRPNVSVLTGAEGATDVKGEFDFADGKDDGSKNYLLRNKGLDIVELQERADAIIEMGNNIKNDIAEMMKNEADNNLGIENGAPRIE